MDPLMEVVVRGLARLPLYEQRAFAERILPELLTEPGPPEFRELLTPRAASPRAAR